MNWRVDHSRSASEAGAPPSEPDEPELRYHPGELIHDGLVAWEQLGNGRFCESWMAWSMTHGRPVTVKLAKRGNEIERARRVLRREAAALERFAHPAYQRLLGGDLEASEPYLVIEYIEGFTLGAMLENDGRFGVRDALNFVTELVAALGFIHRGGYGHLDINPANVIARDGRIVVMDLGLVMPLGSEMESDVQRGTKGYIAPEQWDDVRCTPAMDFFSVGCVLYELLTGETPYDFDGPPTEPLPPLRRRWLSPARRRRLDHVIAQLTHRDPDQRPQTAEQAMMLLATARLSRDPLWPRWVDPHLAGPVAGRPSWLAGLGDHAAESSDAQDFGKIAAG